MPASKEASSAEIKHQSQTSQPHGRYVMSQEEQSAFMVEHFKRLARSNKAEATAALQRAGILDKKGNLTKYYRAPAAA
jgi:hypothetical protein